MNRTDASAATMTPYRAALRSTEAAVVWAKFAAGAMAGLCSAQQQNGEWAHGSPRETAKIAAEMADALFTEYLERG